MHSILITGCSGGGKSTLLQALSDKGFATVMEPGRRIVAEGPETDLPWVNMNNFANRALAMALADLEGARTLPSPVFFDRGVVDAAVALQFSGGPDLSETLEPRRHYATKVIFAPPWPAIFAQNTERKHSFEEAQQEIARLEVALTRLGYTLAVLPKSSVQDRVDWVCELFDLN